MVADPRAYERLVGLPPAGDRVFWFQIPKTDNSGQPINPVRIRKYAEKIGDHFGGFTTIPSVFGCWTSERNGEKEAVCEESVLIMAARDVTDAPRAEQFRAAEDDADFMKDLAEEVAQEFGQEAIMKIEDYTRDVEFVSGEKKKRLSGEKILTEFDEAIAPLPSFRRREI